MFDQRRVSFDPHAALAAGEAISRDGDVGTRAGWGETLFTAALAAVAVLLVSFFIFVIGTA